MVQETQVMTPVFADRQHQAALVSEAMTWLDTPFHAHAGIKGAGVDCVQLALQIYLASGFLNGSVTLPTYSMDGGNHRTESQVEEWVRKSGRFIVIEPTYILADWMPGDLLGFNVGKVVHHVGLALEHQQFIHVMKGQDVCIATIADPTWWRRLRHVWRPMQ